MTIHTRGLAQRTNGGIERKAAVVDQVLEAGHAPELEGVGFLWRVCIRIERGARRYARRT